MEFTMKKITLFAAPSALLSIICASVALGQQLTAVDTRSESFEDVLGFETLDGSVLPEPWIAEGYVTLDTEIARSGRSAARIALADDELRFFFTFRSLILRLPIDFVGTSVELRGFRKAENFTRGAAGPIAIDWTEFRVTAPLDPSAHTLELAIPQIPARGIIWLDDLEILVDGLPLNEVPRVRKVMTELEIAELIARAERAGPQSIADNATIKTVHSAEIKVLREGSNSWVCWAEPIKEDPMCNEPDWDDWLLAFWNQRQSFEVERLSTSYMLDSGRPHIMILPPNVETFEGVPASPPVYTMYSGTPPYGHIMIETGQESATEPVRDIYGPSRTQQILVDAVNIMPPLFEPIEVSMTMLERYTGTYELANSERGFPVTVSASAEGLNIQFGSFPPQKFLPATETVFMDGEMTEAVFELDENGNVMRLVIQGEDTYQRVDL
jgi:hypothetical protein